MKHGYCACEFRRCIPTSIFRKKVHTISVKKKRLNNLPWADLLSEITMLNDFERNSFITKKKNDLGKSLSAR